MDVRKWNLTLEKHEENFSGLRAMTECSLFYGWQMMPTPDGIRMTIEAHAPEYEADERWMPIQEQIEDSLELGFFSISLRRKDRADREFETYSLGFMEV